MTEYLEDHEQNVYLYDTDKNRNESNFENILAKYNIYTVPTIVVLTKSDFETYPIINVEIASDFNQQLDEIFQ